MNKIITISRQYGSGGREIGQKLAKKLAIPYYDNELITRAAKESGFAESAFAAAESRATNSLLYSIAMGMSTYGSHELGVANLSLDDQIYLAQANVIHKVAEEGPCVIIGRCADYILKEKENVVRLFIHATLPFRIERAVQIDKVEENKAEETISRIDKRRSNYYNYHSGEKWGLATNYHLSIDSSYLGIDHAVDSIYTFLMGL